LLQVFLNLVDNSRRALQDVAQPELRVTAREQSGRVVVRVEDNGAGVSAPEALFQPFQNGADVHGLGLYVSRAILRGFAGELRFERRPQGCCFAVELTAAEPAARVA
jgi:C4-dicarboxylate-specific signal transduction histidine kinase